MILGSLIVSLLCFGTVQVREIFRLHDTKDHDLREKSLENSVSYIYDVDHERDHLSIHVFVNTEARNALSDPASLWPDQKIIYTISEDYESEEKETILEAMEEFKNKTCIRFEPRRKEEIPFILIEPGSGCSATVGKSDEGKVSLGKGCHDKGIIIHELMHTLGFLHEHSRPDRDEYVEINWENIQEKFKPNFKKNGVDEVEDGNITYDYNSIMHYGENNFAKNRSIPTIITLKENVTIGQRDGFSENDIAKILERYGCGKAETDHTDKTAQNIPIEPTKSLAEETKNPSQSTENPILSTKNPGQSTKIPVQSTKIPVQSTKNSVQSAKNPIQSTKNPIQSTKNPIQSTKPAGQSTKPAGQSTGMETIALDKMKAGGRKSSAATVTTPKDMSRTNVIQKTTQTKNIKRVILNKLATVISKLKAAKRKTTPIHTTMAKLAAESQKTTRSQTTIQSTKIPVQSTKNPVQLTKNPVQSTKNPVQSTKNPVQSTKNPVQSTKNPVQSTKNPVQSTKNPVQSAEKSSQKFEDPVQTIENALKSTKMTTIALKKLTPGSQKSSAGEVITNKDMARTTAIQKITQTKDIRKDLLSQLATIIAKLKAIDSKTTPILTTIGKLAAESLKMTPSYAAIPAKRIPASGSESYKRIYRYKRFAELPRISSSEDGEEPEAPKVFETLKVESPQVEAESHQVEVESPQVEVESPKLEVESPKLEVKSPKLEVESPKLEVESPKLEVESPKLEVESPKLEVESPKLEVESPKLEVESPKLEVESPKLEVESPKLEVEFPKLEVESPKVEERLGVDHTFDGKNVSTDLDDFRVRFQIWKNQYQNWWSYYHNWIQQLMPTAEPMTEIIVVEEPLLSQRPREIKSLIEENPTEDQIVENNDPEAPSFRRGFQKEASSDEDSHTQVVPSSSSKSSTTVTAAPCGTSPNCENPVTDPSESATTTSDSPCPDSSMTNPSCMRSRTDVNTETQSIISEAETTHVSTSDINSETEETVKSNSERTISTSSDTGKTSRSTTAINNTPIITQPLTVDSNTISPEWTTAGIKNSKHELSDEATSESGISTDPSITIVFSTTEITETENSEVTSSEPTALSSTSPTSKPPEIANLESDISTSNDPGSNTPEVSTASITTGNENSEDIAPESMTPGSSSPTANSSEQKTSESDDSVNSDSRSSTPGVLTISTTKETANFEANAPRNIPTETALESLASDLMSSIITTANSIDSKDESQEEKTPDVMTSTSSTPATIIPESKSSIGSTFSGMPSENVNSEAKASELTTSNTMTACETLRQTTLGNIICTVSGFDQTVSEVTLSEVRTPEGVSSESANSDSTASQLTTENLTDFATEPPEQTTLGSFSSARDAPCRKTANSKNCAGDPDRPSLSTESVNSTPNAPCENKCGKNDNQAADSPENDSFDSKDLESRAMQPKFPEGLSPSKKELVESILGSVDNEEDSIVSTTTEPDSVTDPNVPAIAEDNILADQTVATTADPDTTVEPSVATTADSDTAADPTVPSTADTESTELPFELAVDASEHSTPHHKIRMYRPLQGRTAVKDRDRLWPNGIVPYKFSDKYNDTQKASIEKGMEAINKESCVMFVKKKNETSFILIEPENGCNSAVGKQDGQSGVTISEGCYLPGTIVHELMHALGFYHEQTRPDRDDFIKVKFDNIKEENKKNFEKLSSDQATTLGVVYDYVSVMHYRANEFAVDPDKPTLVPLQSGVKQLGNKEGLSKKDIIKLNKLYECPMKRGTTEGSKGKSDGTEASKGKSDGTEASKGKSDGTEASKGKSEGTEASKGKNDGTEASKGKSVGTEASKGKSAGTKASKGKNDEASKVMHDDTNESKGKKEGMEGTIATAQALLQKLLKYFELNFQRLFRSILRTIQRFRPIILNARSLSAFLDEEE